MNRRYSGTPKGFTVGAVDPITVGAVDPRDSPSSVVHRWADAQRHVHACAGNDTRTAPRTDRYAYFRTAFPIGNAMNSFVHLFLYSLVTGRQPAIGPDSGRTVGLMCGPEGAFACGLPWLDETWLAGR